MDKVNKYQELANKFADLIEQNEAPWQKPWSGQGFLPYNIKSEIEYNGMNLFNLMMVAEARGYEDNRWLTFLQASELGAKVRPGEKGMHIMFLQTKENVKEIDEITGEEKIVTVKLEKPRAMWSVVFNAEQCEGLPAYQEKLITFNPIEKAEEILNNSGATIIHKKQNEAFYDTVTDTITLPLKEQFKSPEAYYRCALHELGHWTAHEKRNNRDLSGSFGSESYAREELVAEITSFLVGTQCGLGHEPNENNVAYLKSWAKEIRDDPSYLFKAVKDADKAAQLILGKNLEMFKEIEKEQEQVMENHNKLQENLVTYINVPKEEKDHAKELGAKWDRNNMCWFIPADKDLSLFDKWERIDEKDLAARKEKLLQQQEVNKQSKVTYINVPKEEKDQAKALGAKWDRNNMCWFVPADKDLSLFDKWERIDEKDLIARKEQLHQNKKENDTEKGFFKDLAVKFAWSEDDFGIKDNTMLKGVEAYEFLDKLVKKDAEQNKIQERKLNGENIDGLYFYKTKFAINYKSHNSEIIHVDIGDLEFGGKAKVSEAIEFRATIGSAILIPKEEMQSFKKEEERYLKYLQEKQVNMKNEKYILAVPYEEREQAKTLGAKWDKDGKFWYCQEAEKENFFKWDIKNVENKVKSDIPLNIEEEFLNRIKSAGVLENAVIADGQKHRISVDGDKGKEQSGFYVLHADGVANGYFFNNRTGEEIKWNSKENSYNSMTPEEKAEMKALYQARKAEREQEDKILTEKAEKALYAKFMNREAINEHSYLTNKMVEATQNIYAGNDSTITVPLYNVDGRLKSAQYIDADGNKRFAKNTNKVGAFHIVDGNAADLKSATSIIIAEGYATAASINEAVKEPGLKVIAAMSANNLEHTVKAITEKYPAINIVIAADNDIENKVGNIGLNAAKNVSEKYKNVTVVIPKINGKEVAGDFNDIVSKKGLTKEEAFKAIQYSIKSQLKHNKSQEQNKTQNRDIGRAI